MTDQSQPEEVRAMLGSIYEEIMWLARRPNVTASMARGWYTHIFAEKLKRQIRNFSGKVSQNAAMAPNSVLRLEHYQRIQTTLTSFVARHLTIENPDPNEFINLVIKHEQVHIVTFEENYAAMQNKGDYEAANIKLLPWSSLSAYTRMILWPKMLRGKVANASLFQPSSDELA